MLLIYCFHGVITVILECVSRRCLHCPGYWCEKPQKIEDRNKELLFVLLVTFSSKELQPDAWSTWWTEHSSLQYYKRELNQQRESLVSLLSLTVCTQSCFLWPNRIWIDRRRHFGNLLNHITSELWPWNPAKLRSFSSSIETDLWPIITELIGSWNLPVHLDLIAQDNFQVPVMKLGGNLPLT